MALTINHPDANILVQELISYTDETLTQAVLNALRERIKKEKEKRKGTVSLKDELLQIGKECAALPILDNRTPEEILGYNNNGVTN
ncbi:type II toxin-antitoxin system VapB family antitoxin [Candidatus Parabeggiatoa sp. HSG14]|uniref:type II toxin-antitoxin system VapB family antitoxin n=1 Tax=Candidatus Parabeggiatoa sp. HSG14 TaxID=3055593 RepID=UPI0025A770DA|nr:type II toxin-antitoxin system VapB family antitoxin [Thiotrichales bacterium HSG14]